MPPRTLQRLDAAYCRTIPNAVACPIVMPPVKHGSPHASPQHAMSNYTLTETSPPEPPGIRCRYFLPDRDQTNRMDVVIVSFDGEYPDGSRGNAHGSFIAVSAMHGLLAFDADCIVLDLRGLTYRWGNSLLRVFGDISQFKDCGAEPDDPPFPIAVVTSDRCRDAFLSLVTPRGQEAPEWHFDDLDAAIAYGARKAEDWLEL